jgi:hypothetical protein
MMTAQFLLSVLLLAASLPTFEDFRRVDRMRRLTGQLHTAESLDVTRIDPGLIVRTAEQHANDPKMIWAAAELLNDWPNKRAQFEVALREGGTNEATLVRYACAAAQNRDFEFALPLLQDCQKRYRGTLAPWLAELWVFRQKKQPLPSRDPPDWASFSDYGAEAARARVRFLEAAGYSPYAARRLGFMPDSYAIAMGRDLAQPPIDANAASALLTIAKAMQMSQTFLLTELVGQTLERSALASKEDADTSADVRFRVVEMDKRREEIKTLLADVEHNAVEMATEQEMVQYFDNVLSMGEEAAMKRLAETVRGKAAAP